MTFPRLSSSPSRSSLRRSMTVSPEVEAQRNAILRDKELAVQAEQARGRVAKARQALDAAQSHSREEQELADALAYEQEVMQSLKSVDRSEKKK